MTARLRVRALVLGMLVAGAIACDATGPSSVAGTYGLATVNGASLPVQGVVADTIVLRDDGGTSHCVRRQSSDPSVPGTVICHLTAQYSVSGQIVTFTALSSSLGGSGPVTATVHDGTLEYSQSGNAYLFLRK